jgi:hypothetical protein
MNYDEWMKKESLRKQSVYITDKVYSTLYFLRDTSRDGSNQKMLSLSEVINAAVELCDSKLLRYVKERYKGESKKEAMAVAIHGEKCNAQE